eukprot:TRINITY_DN3285_c0_g1_i1.p1 TRINITY_DN3285_c0_g1~~TRINITY_DN3285_c0_g1_i1.p1  ORF type:complete len:775 (+),score=256.10 TRINITY_DN3285_c0_g1_i1:283-2607(+)
MSSEEKKSPLKNPFSRFMKKKSKDKSSSFSEKNPPNDSNSSLHNSSNNENQNDKNRSSLNESEGNSNGRRRSLSGSKSNPLSNSYKNLLKSLTESNLNNESNSSSSSSSNGSSTSLSKSLKGTSPPNSSQNNLNNSSKGKKDKHKNKEKVYCTSGMESGDLIQLLHYESEIGHNHQAAYSLLKQDPKILNAVDATSERAAIHLAAMSGCLEILLLLLAEGSNPNQSDKYGWTPLHFAASAGNENIILHLLQNPDVKVDLKNQDGNSPLHYAVRKGITEEILDSFIRRGADINSINDNGDSPLHHNCAMGIDCESTKLIVQHGANIHIANKNGETPLHWAARTGRTEIVEYLLSKGADKKVRGRDGRPWDVSVPIDGLRKALVDSGNTIPFFRASSQIEGPINENSLRSMSRGSGCATDSPLSVSSVHSGESHWSSITTPSVLPKLSQEPSKKGTSIIDYSVILPEFPVLFEFPEVGSQWVIKENELEFIEKIGSGASSKVYKAIYRNEEVAVKILKGYEKTAVQDFIKEFHIISSLRSPYVIYFYGIVTEPVLSIVMQYFPRKSLNHVMKESFFMGWDLFFKFTKDIVHCINSLHSWKPQIVHRDLKSLNLLVDENGNIRICDFGLSRFTTAQSTLGKLRGTFAFCAPELYFGEAYTPASDIYSLSIIMWELVHRTITGFYARPFGEFPLIVQELQIIIQVSKKGLRPTIPLGCPEDLASIITTCWNADPLKRMDCNSILSQLKKLQLDSELNSMDWNSALRSPFVKNSSHSSF